MLICLQRCVRLHVYIYKRCGSKFQISIQIRHENWHIPNLKARQSFLCLQDLLAQHNCFDRMAFSPMATCFDDLAEDLASESQRWPPEKLDDLECLRECLRALLLACGLHEETMVLADLWVQITRCQVRLNSDHSGHDIDYGSIGVPVDLKVSIPKAIEQMNPYQHQHFKRVVMKSMDCLRSLTWVVFDQLLVDVLEVLEMV